MWFTRSQGLNAERVFNYLTTSCSISVMLFTLMSVGSASATPLPNSATVELRTFNDCPGSTLMVSNNYPASIEISDVMNPFCLSFANLHSWSFSEDGGLSAAVFNNDSNFRFAADFKLDGTGQGSGGLRISPWWAQFVEGRCQVSTSGDIACFGGRLPLYSFTSDQGLTYTVGTTIRLEMIYRARSLSAADPARIRYRAIYNGIVYKSPELLFDSGNPAEDPPYGLWGMLNNGRVGGFFQPQIGIGFQAALTANWSNITYLKGLAEIGFTLSPDVLNLNAQGKRITGYLEPPVGYSINDIDISSIRLNGSIGVVSDAPVTIGDEDRDGITDLAVKFDRAATLATLAVGNAVPVTVSGFIAGEEFSGVHLIRVTSK